MPRSDAIRAFHDGLREESAVDGPAARRLHARALVGVDSTDAGESLRTRLVAALDQALNAHLGVCRTLGPDDDPVQRSLSGRPGYMEFLGRKRSALDDLDALIGQLDQPRPRPDGYTVRELMKHADIKKGTWQAIVQLTNIKIRPGESSRRFSNAEIRELINAARRYGKRKGEGAARAWEELLDVNTSNLI